MKVRTEPLLGAVAFGVIFLVVGNLIYLMLTYQGLQTMLNSQFFDPEYLQALDQGTINPAEQAALESDLEETMGSMWMFSGVGGLISCLTWLIAGIGAGFLYPVLYKRQYGPLESGAVGGGAASGALGHAVGYLFTSIVSTLLIMPLMTDWMNQLIEVAGPTAGPPPNFGAMWATWLIIGAICGTIFMAVIGALLGAVGGAVGGAFAK